MQPYGLRSIAVDSVVPYHEYPGDMAFAIIDRLAKDMVRGGVLIQSANKDLRDALYTRLRNLDFENKCYRYVLNYFYGACAVMTFLAGENPKLGYVEGSYLSAVNVASFLPNINSAFVAQVAPTSLWSFAHGEPYVTMGSDLLRNGPLCQIIVEWKPSLYAMLKPYSDTVRELTEGIYTAAKRLGMIVGNKKIGDTPAEQERLLGDIDELRSAGHDAAVFVDIDEKVTNMAMNMSGLKEAAEKCYYDMSILASMPQNVLLGKGQGVAASAVEDFRTYANRIKYEQDLRLRPLYRKVFRLLLKENIGIMKPYEYEDVEFDFAPLQAETEKEKAETLKCNIDNILNLRSIGIEPAAASAIDDQISDLMQQYADSHANTQDKKIEGEETVVEAADEDDTWIE